MLFNDIPRYIPRQNQSALLRSDDVRHISDNSVDIGVACDGISVNNTVEIDVIPLFDTAGDINTSVHFYDTMFTVHWQPVLGQQENITIAVCRHIMKAWNGQSHKAF